MKNEEDTETLWQLKQVSHFNASVGFFELGLLDEAEMELDKIDRSAATDAVPVLALRLNICYRRKQWNKMAALATQLFLLDQSNARWAYAHGFATTTNTTFTATFKTQYFLTMTHGTGGRVSPASGWKNSGAVVSISATPANGYSFSNWTGSGTGSYSGPNNPASITMGGPITETATFIHN